MQCLRLSLTIPLVAMFLASGCAHSFGWVSPLEAATPSDAEALDAAVNTYYTAKTSAALRTAVTDALAAGPGTARAHEIAASLARLDEDLSGQVDHLLAALADTKSDATALHMSWLRELHLTTPERRRVLARVTQLSRSHPNPTLRAAAATVAADLHGLDANYGAMDTLHASHFPTLDMAFIGTWDNDQGKGFETTQPPEKQIDLTARYAGTVVEVGWRQTLPQTRRGAYHLDSLMSPNTWATAYATAVLEAEQAEPYELRMATTSPFKVWLNGQLIAAVEERHAVSAFDGFVLALPLRRGPNRLLVKLSHRKGTWTFRPRITGPNGSAAQALRVGDPGMDVPLAGGPAPSVMDATAFTEHHNRGLEGSAARKQILLAAWAENLGLQTEAIGRIEAALSAHPDAIIPTYLLASMHWDHQERGQAADLLGGLDRTVGEDLPFIRGQQARFWMQQGRNDQARDHLLTLRDAHPDRAHIWVRMAIYFDKEDWHQERCQAWETALEIRPRWPYAMEQLAICYDSLTGGRSSLAMLSNALDEMPGGYGILKHLRQTNERVRRIGDALKAARHMTIAWPTRYGARVLLADLYRKDGQTSRAKETYLEATNLDPDASWAHKRLGALARERGDIPGAVKHWKDALSRNPDDDSLARYVSYHEAGPEEAWLADVPDMAAIESAITKGRSAPAPKGADAVALIDHRVMRLYADGSRAGVVTQVILALNEQGRDRITSMRLGEPGRVQVLNAFASNPDGARVEATRPRDGKVRFRALEDRSAVVLQFRFDSGAQPYLALHMAETWSFHMVGWASTWSEWVLWLGTDEVVHEQGLGEYIRGESAHDDLKRISWAMRDVPPVIPEPGAPSHLEVVNNVVVSTVPSWETFMRWEAALLSGAFRSDPRLEALANTLVSPEDSPAMRVAKIHEHVMNQIRYEQDYENTIAGVKPHAAPVVLERRYGDCKDKAVLFITLARLVGVEVHFAILKTRPKGPVYRKVPYQQFDHAIVYVPAQTGIETGRFYDPTADALDLDVLRQDDAGTTALVYDPVAETHTWIPIPFQDPSAHLAEFSVSFTLAKNGSADGVLTLNGRGSMGSRLRRSARNRAKFDKWLTGLVGVMAPGANVDDITLVEVKDLTKNAIVQVTFNAPDVALISGKEARLTPPWNRLYRVSPAYKLPKRRYDLIRGVPEHVDMNVEYTLPKGTRLITVPKNEQVNTPCSSLNRTVSTTKQTVTLATRLTRNCERITPQDYEAQRQAAKRVDELNAEAVVIRLR